MNPIKYNANKTMANISKENIAYMINEGDIYNDNDKKNNSAPNLVRRNFNISSSNDTQNSISNIQAHSENMSLSHVLVEFAFKSKTVTSGSSGNIQNDLNNFDLNEEISINKGDNSILIRNNKEDNPFINNQNNNINDFHSEINNIMSEQESVYKGEKEGGEESSDINEEEENIEKNEAIEELEQKIKMTEETLKKQKLLLENMKKEAAQKKKKKNQMSKK